ncbi:MAG: aspartate ammonia-lyase [Candidatus Aenigmarchaeota archaeon]|nr:aspartate ammonia-lyase [Candidatus Aenigmarchaeota archaeon]
MPSYRTEKDSLGEKRVPADAYYGIFTQRAKENFPLSGTRVHPRMIWALAVIKEAAAEANKELEMLDARTADAIVRASKEVQKGKFNDAFVIDVFQAGAGTPTNMNANEVIANRATQMLGGKIGTYIVHPNNHVNMGQSTNNVFPSAMRIAVFSTINDLITQLKMLESSLRKKAKQFRDVIKVGRTHLQDAVPLLLGQEFEAYADYVKRGYVRMRNLSDELLELGVGGTAIGTQVNAHPHFRKTCVSHIAKITGEKFYSTESPVYLTQSVDSFVQASAVLRAYATDALKIANDLILMTSGPKAGLHEIELPEVEPGSSIMPGKINPSIVEAYKMVCLQALGNDHAIEHASREGQLELNPMTPVIAHNLLSSVDLLTNGTKMFRERCVDGIRANREACERTFANSLSVATALTPYIGYEVTAYLVKEALKKGFSIREVVLEHGLMTEGELTRILNPYRMTHATVVDRELKTRILKSDAFRKLSRKV